MDHMRMQQHTRRPPVQQARDTDEDILNEGEYDDAWPARMPSSTRRYQSLPDVRSETGRRQVDAQPATGQRFYTPGSPYERHTAIPPRRTATQSNLPAVQSNRHHDVYTGDTMYRNSSGRLRSRQEKRYHWLVFVGLAMIVMLIGWFAFSALGNWWQTTLDDWHYGRPRTFQTDAVVGHNDSPTNPSHFVAINLNRHILIIELPGGDASKAKIYVGPILIGQGQELTPVTLTFKDVNGDGLLDMVINVQDSHFVFINEKGGFRPARPGEGVQSWSAKQSTSST
jgi:hypothetical protein